MPEITLAVMLGGWEVFFVLCVLLLVPLVAVGAGLTLFFVLRSRRQKPPSPQGAAGRQPRHCPQCGAELKPDAPEGLCPACLLRHGVATESGAPARPPFVAPAATELARLFPQLEILGLLGTGGMGAVYKARQPALDRIVALKILAPHAGGDLDFAGRFSREARALARLSHPNIVAVYDFGQANGLHYFIMEYVDGPNLRQIEQAGRLTPREALQIVPQICAALQFAHDEGIVHRDIKPENVLLDKKGHVKIADFGLAKILGQASEDSRLTGAKDIMGTPHYMAPEQVETPQEVDHRADIYSLGVVFYEMLTGELPLGKFQPPSRKVQVDVRLDEVVLRALAREPELRYQQASEVQTDVETITTGEGLIPGSTAKSPASARPKSAGAGRSLGREEQRQVSRAELVEAEREVKGPAIGLIVTGVLEAVIISFVVILVGLYHGSSVQREEQNVVTLTGCLGFVAVLFLAGFIVYAGLRMQRLEGWRRSVIASLLAVVFAPANLLGLPIGIWALVVLSRREVHDAFDREPPCRRRGPWLSLVGKQEGRRVIRSSMVAVTVVQIGLIAALLWVLGVGGWILSGVILLLLIPLAIALFRGFSAPVDQLPEAQSPQSRRVVRAGWWCVLGLTVVTALAAATFGAGSRGLFGPAEPNLSVTGTVTDAETGNPIAGARVDDNRYGANRTPQQAWTDTNGHYELRTWYEEHNIAVSAPGYETKLTNLMTKLFGSEREVRMDFRLQPATPAGTSVGDGR